MNENKLHLFLLKKNVYIAGLAVKPGVVNQIQCCVMVRIISYIISIFPFLFLFALFVTKFSSETSSKR